MDLHCIERLLLAIFCSFLCLVSSQETANFNGQTYRTAYHFQPQKSWMNDPCGPMNYKGVYHLFYQYQPEGVLVGKRVWGHSTSTDMINWAPQGIALPRSIPSDINGSWTGSTTILHGDKPAILYTGINTKNQQTQNLATPKNLQDPNLIEWVKYPHNPVMAPTHLNSSSFRDPTTAWLLPDGQWRVVVGSKRDRVGMALVYRSKDFMHWEKAENPLHSVDGNGMWECPDFYPVYINRRRGADTSTIGSRVKHVLKVSLDDTRREYYTIGEYEAGRYVYTPDRGSVEADSGLRYDYGKFYASKTFFDSAKKRRVLWGWINESSSDADNVKKGWAGIQAIPRTVFLDRSGKQLVHWPIHEVERLREKPVKVAKKAIQGGSISEISGVTASQADVEVSFKVGDLMKAEELDEVESRSDPRVLCNQKGASVRGGIGPFGLLVLASKGLEEHTAVFFRVFKTAIDGFVVLMCSDQSRSSLNPTTDKTSYGAFVRVDPTSEEFSLRTLIDHSIVESFGAKGKSCITARVYPTLAIRNDARLYAFNNGTESVEITRLSAWSIFQKKKKKKKKSAWSMKTAQIS